MRKNSKTAGKNIVLILALLVLAAGGIMVVRHKKAQLAAVPGPVQALLPVTTARVESGIFSVGKKFLATLKARSAAQISPRLSAYITEVRGREGDIVRKDDILVLLDDRQERDRVAELEARLAAAQTLLATEEAVLDRDRELFTAKALSREALDRSTSRRVKSSRLNVVVSENIGLSKRIRRNWTIESAISRVQYRRQLLIMPTGKPCREISKIWPLRLNQVARPPS